MMRRRGELKTSIEWVERELLEYKQTFEERKLEVEQHPMDSTLFSIVLCVGKKDKKNKKSNNISWSKDVN